MKLGDVLIRKPEVVNLMGERDLEVQSAFYWLQETVLNSSFDSYFSLQRDAQYIPSLSLRLDSVLSRLLSLEDFLISSHNSDIVTTSNTTALLFNFGCSKGDVACESTLLARGVHSAILGLGMDVRYAASSISQLGSKDVSELEKASSYLHQQFLSILSSTQARLSSNINTIRLRVELLTVAYCFICVLFYILIYLPMARLVQKQLTDIWDLAGLIPIDLLERIKRAMRVVGEGKQGKV